MRVLCVHHEEPISGGTYDDVLPAEGHDVVRWAPFAGEERPQLDTFDAVIVYGGAVHPDADETDPWLGEEVALIRDGLARGTPLLGLCLGAQLIARATGSWVGRSSQSEVGWYRVVPNDAGLADPVVGALGGPAVGFQWHHYTFEVPDGAVELARSASCTQAFRLGTTSWGVQFHPEVSREQIYTWTGMAPEQVQGSVDDVRAETDRRITDWNATGRRLLLAFLEQAHARRPQAPGG